MKIQDATIPRDPEDRVIDTLSRHERKEKMLDKTIADSFPASDPPSSIPDPDEDSFASASVQEGWRPSM
jgi:hypothetical protein